MVEEMLTTAPPSPSSMSGGAARSAWAVDTLKWNARSKRPIAVSEKGRGVVPPTLLTTTSSRPNSSRAVVAREATTSRS